MVLLLSMVLMLGSPPHGARAQVAVEEAASVGEGIRSTCATSSVLLRHLAGAAGSRCSAVAAAPPLGSWASP